MKVSQGERFCSQNTNQRIRAKAKSEQLIASISIIRPFSISPRFVSQQSAAMKEPIGPRLLRPSVGRVRAAAKVNKADGRREVHSLRIPESLNEAATSQLINGGLFK